MSTYDLEEQEQLAALKAWWNQYGNLVVLTITLAALVFAAFEGWRYWQRSQAAKASAVYNELVRATRAADTKKVRDLAGTLTQDFPRTAYATLGALASAKRHFDAGDLKSARVQLEWVIANTRDPELESIARLRLASVLLDDKAYDDALKILDAKHEASFDGLFAAMRGDVLAAKGAKAEARSAYKAALEKLGKDGSGARESIQIRLDSLGAG